MGFTSVRGDTRAQAAARATRGAIETALVGGACYALMPSKAGNWIMVVALEKGEDGWRYKELAEAEHPYYYACPLRFLDRAHEQNKEWRRGVRAYHAERKAKACARKGAPS